MQVVEGISHVTLCGEDQGLDTGLIRLKLLSPNDFLQAPLYFDVCQLSEAYDGASRLDRLD